MNKKLVGLALAVGMFAIATPAFASTWYVDATVSSSGDGITALTALKTIQEAVATSTSGDTINVAAGTYTEQINVGDQYHQTTWLIFKGSNTGISAGAHPGNRNSEPIIIGGFRLWGGSSVIDGFKIQGGFIMSGAAHSGIVVGSANGGSPNVTIENNIIQNVTGNQSNGIEVVAGSNNLTIKNNKISGNWRGIYLNTASGVSITGNLIDANNGSGVGIGSDGQSSLTISGNTISNQTEGWGSSTVGANVVAHDNSFIENTVSVAWYSGSTIDATNNYWGSAVLATVASKITGSVTFKPYYIDSGMTTLSSVANVADFTTLKAALADTDIATINITADIPGITEELIVGHAVTINGGGKTLTFTSALNALADGHRDGIFASANGTTINNLSVVMAGTPNHWDGVYGIQFYGVTGGVVSNYTGTGADAALLINGSAVELTGATTVSGNDFGGIEVSKGTLPPNTSALTVTGTLVNSTEAYGKPTIWLVNGQGSVTGANVPVTTRTTVKAGQTQYYLTAGNVTTINVPANYPTISAAIAAANPGDTIIVAAGTYTGDVLITKNNLTLKGAQAGVDARTRSGAESIISGASPVVLLADNLTIDGFTIQDSNDTDKVAGIWSNPGSNASDVGGYTIINNIIQNNVIGLGIGGTTNTTLIEHNLFRNNNNPGPASGSGIYAAFALAHVTINENAFVGNLYGSIVFGSTESDITVSNNDSDNSNYFMDVSGVASSSITGNTVTSSSGTTGIHFAGGNNGITVSGNTLQNGLIGIHFEGTGDSNVSINTNKFGGNTQAGLEVDAGAYTGALDATKNWWNSVTGPTIASNTNINRGDSIVGGNSVTYRPWCLISACSPVDATTVSIASATVTPSPAKNGNTVTVTLVFNKTMNTALPPTVGLVGITAGTTTVALTSYTGNTWIGTATVATSTHSELTANVSVYDGEDIYGNQFAGTASATTLPVDSLSPSITAVDITQTGANPNWLKIGDHILFTVNTAKAEPGATVSGSYEGRAITSWTPNGGNTQFTGTYTVQSGDANQASPVQITGVTVTDAAGNTSFAGNSTDVTKGIDANAPVATLADSFSASTTISTGATASDIGSGITSYVWSKLTGPGTVTFSNSSALNPTISASLDGDYTLQLVVTDVAGNATTVTTTLHWDTAVPVVATHAGIPSNEATSHAGAVVSFTNPTADDGSTVTCSPASGSTFGLGTITVTCTATDAAGNTGSSTFGIGVIDTTAPTITLIGTDPMSVLLGNTFTDPGATTTDNYDADTFITASSAPDTSVAGAYTITYNHTDSNGNATSTTRTVNVSSTELSVMPGTPDGGGNSTGTLTNAATSTISSGGTDITVEIPAGTNVTGGAGWDGTINLPTVSTSFTSPTADSGTTVSVKLALEVGSSTSELTFSKGVRLFFEGQAGNRIGWTRNGGAFTEITDKCSTDSQAVGNALIAGADCKIVSGSDMVVWTKHFTTFVTYTQTAIPAPTPVSSSNGAPVGGGSGVGGGSVIPTFGLPNSTPAANNAPTSNTGGEVLGASAYQFSANLTTGSTGNDVTELQKVLIAEGDLSIGAPTGVFGPLTKAAVIKYQMAHKISPQSGYVGSMTRGVLGQGSEPTTPEVLGASAYNFTRALSVGSNGADVTALQNVLTTTGNYTGPVTGYFGALTKAAVQKYQTSHTISATGTIGPLTRASLNKGI